MTFPLEASRSQIGADFGAADFISGLTEVRKAVKPSHW
jgi:hypothetical protein